MISFRNLFQICGIFFHHPLFHLYNILHFVIMNLSQLTIAVKTAYKFVMTAENNARKEWKYK